MLKTVFVPVVLAGLLTACTATKEVSSTDKLSSAEKKAAEQMAIKKAIESRKYVIRADKIQPSGGLPVDLVPRHNFIIINGELASVSLAYLGRSFGVRQITGINFNGRTGKYQMKSNEAKGTYDIYVEVLRDNDKFDLYLTLGTEGYCSFSINNSYIETMRYSGTIEPLAEKPVRAKATGTKM